MDTKTETKMIVIISTISIIVVTMTSAEQMVNAAASTTSNSSTLDCQSKKGSASTTIFGTLGYAGGTCTGENGGTVAAGGVKSNSGAIGIHGIQGPNGNSHVGGFRK